MSEYVKTEQNGYIKNLKSKIIESTDDEYKKFLETRNRKKNERSLQEQINTMKTEIVFLRQQIQDLLDKNG